MREKHRQSLVCAQFLFLFFFFNFYLFCAPILQYGTPKWSSSDITDFCAQMSASKEENINNVVKRSLLFKTSCKYIYTLNLLLFLYIYIY